MSCQISNNSKYLDKMWAKLFPNITHHYFVITHINLLLLLSTNDGIGITETCLVVTLRIVITSFLKFQDKFTKRLGLKLTSKDNDLDYGFLVLNQHFIYKLKYTCVFTNQPYVAD